MSSGIEQRDSIAASLTTQYPLLGLAMNVHKSTRGLPLSFAAGPFLVEWYTTALDSLGFDIMSSTQSFKTDFLVQLALYSAGWKGLDVTYVLPKDQHRDRFVKTRVNAPIVRTPQYKQMLKPTADKDGTDNLALKFFGKGILRFLGSTSESNFVEFSTDIAIVDELDQCAGASLEMLRDRLRQAPKPQLFRVANPSLPRIGISLLFDEGDGRRWFHKCDRCNHRQPLEWEEHFVEYSQGGWKPKDPEFRPLCSKCRRPFNRRAEGGLWVAERPSIKRRSYHVSRMDVLTQDIADLFEEWCAADGHSARLEKFYNGVLGLPFEPRGMKITAEDLDNTMTGAPISAGAPNDLDACAVVAGIDVGKDLNIVIDVLRYDAEQERELRVCVFAAAVREFNELAMLMRSYKVDTFVIDARPETRKAEELRLEMQKAGIVGWLAQFHPTDRISGDYGMKTDADRSLVTADRTQVLDATMEDHRAHRGIPPARVWPSDIRSQCADWARHMRTPTRIIDPKSGRAIWSKGPPDHFRFADVYARMAGDLHKRGGFFMSF